MSTDSQIFSKAHSLPGLWYHLKPWHLFRLTSFPSKRGLSLKPDVAETLDTKTLRILKCRLRNGRHQKRICHDPLRGDWFQWTLEGNFVMWNLRTPWLPECIQLIANIVRVIDLTTSNVLAIDYFHIVVIETSPQQCWNVTLLKRSPAVKLLLDLNVFRIKGNIQPPWTFELFFLKVRAF